MKLISETTVSRSSMGFSPAYWKPILRVNYGVQRRYRSTGWDFFGFFDRVETEWEDDWVTTQIIEE
jgi:hypothetical protein